MIEKLNKLVSVNDIPTKINELVEWSRFTETEVINLQKNVLELVEEVNRLTEKVNRLTEKKKDHHEFNLKDLAK